MLLFNFIILRIAGNVGVAAFSVITVLSLVVVAIYTGLNIVLSTYLLSTETTFPAQVISLLRSFVILIPMAFFLSSLFKMTGVWCAYPLTEGIVAFIGIWLLCRASRGKQAKFQ